ncbi:hypothetical protein [Streptomyces xylophagus]|uniref:hypothetical protein n=1 Tax=Streptomyces xylophagus TaxID=285514 RepID=UPI0009982C1C|nr:hypothetical protein [Streptomyces xylophagus]
MTVRWLMTLGERTRPDVPTFAECPGLYEARAVALVDDAGQLFPILLEWRRAYGEDLTGWACQVEADDIEDLPPGVTENWGHDELRLDTMSGGYVKVSDYRDHQARAAVPPGNKVLMRP